MAPLPVSRVTVVRSRVSSVASKTARRVRCKRSQRKGRRKVVMPFERK